MAPNKPEFIGLSNPIKLKFPKPKMPKKAAGAGMLIGILMIVGFFVFQTCFTYIEPHEVGIKQVRIGVDKGIQDKVYGPGLAFIKPGMEVIHRFPNTVMTYDLSENSAAKIQTSDGFFVDVDVTILYRISDPLLLMKELGPGEMYFTLGMSPKAIPRLKESLGEMSTEDFYNSPLRVEKAQKARDRLNAELNGVGLEVDHVLVRYFQYSEEIQNNIEEKKLQDQLVFKNQSEGRAATEAALLKQMEQEGEANVLITLQEGEAYKVRKEAEMELYVRTKRAEADLLVQLAEATRSELKNEAMRTMGADRAVAMEMAEVLNGLEVVIIPAGGQGGLNPLDLDSLTQLFGVESMMAPTPTPTPRPQVSAFGEGGSSNEE